MTASRIVRVPAALVLGLVCAAALGGCAAGTAASRPAVPAGGDDWEVAGAKPGDGFPAGWEVSGESAAPAPSDGFPEGWDLPEEPVVAPRKETVSATATVSSTVSSDADLAKARIQVGKAENMLGRLRGTGYSVLVKDDLQAIEGILVQARSALATGDAPGSRELTDDAARMLQKAKARIEAETQQPLRW